MANHNYYTDTLKIQIVVRLLKGESVSSDRPIEQECSIFKFLEEKERELALINSFFSKEITYHFIEKHKN